MTITITKASGEKQPFEKSKLLRSLTRAGASTILAEKIAAEVEKGLRSGMSTQHIYKKAHDSLKKASRPVAGRYHLKTGIMELGPSGFPFELYVSEILHHLGYEVQVGKIVEGKCVKHEIDVIAQKANHHFMIECKYHNSPAMVCDVKVPLYIQARFKDVEARWKEMLGHGAMFHQGWIVTNTRFTTDAITYGTCAGLNLVSLDFPEKGSLREMIEETGLYPLTCLTSLTQHEKKSLLEKKIILCREICHDPNQLKLIGIPNHRLKEILEEGHRLCHKLIQHAQH
ncbi:MAG TPA: ATP cone domain-containing protein [Cyclobacteriaceae bacterium]|nr:ATP cone domain-containing protein [Cyclobacteriaceae bacterium]HRJ80946.1 ATP cone domain-containing protein [Cyclobacteriaceae bacterium]